MPTDEGAGLVEMLLWVQKDVVEAVGREGNCFGPTIRGRARRPPGNRLRGDSRSTTSTILRKRRMHGIRVGEGRHPARSHVVNGSRTTAILQLRQRRRGWVDGGGAATVVPPVLGVFGLEAVGERPELGPVEGVELYEAAPAPAEDLLAGQSRRETEIRVCRRAGEREGRTGR